MVWEHEIINRPDLQDIGNDNQEIESWINEEIGFNIYIDYQPKPYGSRGHWVIIVENLKTGRTSICRNVKMKSQAVAVAKSWMRKHPRG